MTKSALFYPVLAEVALTFVLLFWMGTVRNIAVRSGKVRIKDIALGQSAWPDKVTQVSNCYLNQFQLPVLFYAAVAFAMILSQQSTLFLILAWAFVILRGVHAAVHTGSNFVPWRFFAFLAGALVLLAMWVLLGVRLMSESI